MSRLTNYQLDMLHRNPLINWLETDTLRLLARDVAGNSHPPLGSDARRSATMKLTTKLERLRDLEAQINDVRREVIEQLFFLSPIHLVPPEVLALIFEMTRSKDHVERYFSDLHPIEALNEDFKDPPLMSVCKRWREIALESPRFWTTLEVALSSKSRRIKGTPWNSRLERHIERSRGLPLDIFVNASNLGRSRKTVATILKPCLARCKHYVELGPKSMIFRHLHTPPFSFSALTHLLLSGHEKLALELDDRSSLGPATPQLKHLIIQGYLLEDFPPLTCPELESLVFLNCCGDFDTLSALMQPQLMPKLKKLRLSKVDPEYHLDTDIDFSLPSLEEVTLLSASAYTFPLLKASPNLRYLEIGKVDESEWEHATEDRFFVPDEYSLSPSVETLVFLNWRTGDDSTNLAAWFLNLLRSLSNLNTISFTSSLITDTCTRPSVYHDLVLLCFMIIVNDREREFLICSRLRNFGFENEFIDVQWLMQFAARRLEWPSGSSSAYPPCRVSLRGCHHLSIRGQNGVEDVATVAESVPLPDVACNDLVTLADAVAIFPYFKVLNFTPGDAVNPLIKSIVTSTLVNSLTAPESDSE